MQSLISAFDNDADVSDEDDCIANPQAHPNCQNFDGIRSIHSNPSAWTPALALVLRVVALYQQHG
jgi:hypothetical protein